MLLDEVPAARLHHPAIPLTVAREPHAGVPVGIDDREPAPGTEHASRFRQRALDVRNVEVDLDHGDEIEGGGREREPGGVARLDLHAVRQALARDPGARRLQHLGALVEADDAPVRSDLAAELAGEKGRAASHVETSLAGAGRQSGARPGALGHDRG